MILKNFDKYNTGKVINPPNPIDFILLFFIKIGDKNFKIFNIYNILFFDLKIKK